MTTEAADDIALTQAELRNSARRVLGIEPDGEGAPPLRQVLKDHRLSIYPLAVLGTLSVVDTFQGYAFRVLTPEISETLGIGLSTIAVITALQFIALAVSPLPIAALVQRHPRRAMLCVATGGGWAVATLMTGFVRGAIGLTLVLVADGLTSGSVAALHQPLLLDSYPPQGRVRVLSYYNALGGVGNVLAPLLVAVLAGSAGLTWRGVCSLLGVACVLVVPFSIRLKDPGFGTFDTRRIQEAVHVVHEEPSESYDEVSLGFFEISRRLLLLPTISRLLGSAIVFGLLLIPYNTFLSFYLDEDLGFGPGRRGLFFAFTALCGVISLAGFGRYGEDLFRRDPARVVQLGGTLLAVGVVLSGIAVLVPSTLGAIALFGASSAVIAVLGPALNIALLSVIPANTRPHASALYGIFQAGIGGIAGAILLGGITDRFGLKVGIATLIIPGVVGALLMRSAAKFVSPDIERMIDEVIETEEISRLRRSGTHLPLLSCKNLDFSYGQLQVLFGVDFTVDDGEMVALLGTNGAGKSTLLKVISGIGLPSRGTVRMDGREITYLDPERRAGLGIIQIPGGRGVFNSLTVHENLRSFGYALGRERRSLEGLIDDCYQSFPRLAQRSQQKASTLSGGEQQMLALCKAVIMRPRLLIIDELSLGLAPIIVEELLVMVRAVNQRGTSVVLVEQSVNIALGLVEHAYFMEKGEMRFDGTSSDLLASEGLLRAVFLEGASAGAPVPAGEGR